jgi:aryl-alcohol dehydrogenase-like predicted oxidoreductase
MEYRQLGGIRIPVLSYGTGTFGGNAEQLEENLGAIGWNLNPDQVKRLDAASETLSAYPYWHQRQFPMLNAAPRLYPTR